MPNKDGIEICPRCGAAMHRAEIETTRIAVMYECEVCDKTMEEHQGGIGRYDFDKVRESLVGRRIVGADDVRGMPALQIEGGFTVVVSDTTRTWVERGQLDDEH